MPRELQQVYQIRIAGEGGKALVRRIPVARRAERTKLPVSAAGCLQKFEKPVEVPIERAHPEIAGQACWMKQHAGRAVSQPVKS